VKVVDLPLAGGELLAAAELETGTIAALTDEVVAIQGEALAASGEQTPRPDVERRNGLGQFTRAYNHARRRKRGEEIASYLRPAAEKGQAKVPSWARFTHESPETLDAKLRMLSLGWMVAETPGWEALRAPRVAGLEPLCGFAYLPSTLAKFTSALAQSEAGPRLLRAVGVRGHEVAQAHWGEAGAMAALYVDNHVKEIWTSLFTLSGKVSHLSRVMPCLTTTYVHTGAGTPQVVSVQSGSAPLAPRLLELVKQVETTLGGVVKRAVVIDGEGSTFDLLDQFARSRRVIVTPLKPSRVDDLEFSYSRGSYYRPYRDQDHLRVGEVVLTQKSTGRSLRMGALRVKRAHRESDTVLLTTGLALGMEGRDLADLYFARWPLQENAFKEGAVVQLNRHRGNCGRIISNVAVVTEWERLSKREGQDTQKLKGEQAQEKQLRLAEQEAIRAAERAEARLAVRRRRLEALLDAGRVEGRQLGRAALEQQQAIRERERAEKARQKAEKKAQENRDRQHRFETQIQDAREQQVKLEPQKRIRQLDAALDSVLTATKLAAMMLITFVLREYLTVDAMNPQTFASRVMTVRGRKEIRAEEERVFFYENPRDPETNQALKVACRELNRRKLQRGGRLLIYETSPPSERDRPGQFD
jgi:hypothetical protein